MPKTETLRKRYGVQIPLVMVKEIDRLVKVHEGLGLNRQQFVESAIREKIERLRLIEAGLQRDDAQHLSQSVQAHDSRAREDSR